MTRIKSQYLFRIKESYLLNMSSVSVAKKVQITKDSLNVLGEVFKQGSTFFDILKVSEKLTAAIPVVGVVLVLIGDFLPDEKQAEILRCFEKLSNQVDHVRDDIKELKNVITWKITQLKFGAVVDRIELGMQYCFKIGEGSRDAEMRYQERLEELCYKQEYTLALNALLDGVTGNKVFNSSILDELYNNTKGDKRQISALATRLLQLVCGGLMVIATYETMVRGKEGADEVIKAYDIQLKKACGKVQSVLDDCKTKFEENMKSDLNTFLDKGGSNAGLVTEISDFMTRKYDWLENFVLVYNDLHGFDQHCIDRYAVSSLHRNGKCGIVFYRTKGELPMFSDRYDEAYKIVEDVYYTNAQTGCKNIVAKLDERKIGWTGCAVIESEADLGSCGTFSTKIVRIGKQIIN